MESSMSLLELASKGGWIMIVLGIMSVLAIYIFFERFIAIRKASKSDPLFMERIRDYMKEKDIKSAVNFCRVTNSPAAHMVERGISRIGRPAQDIQTAIENTGNVEVANLERRLPVLSTIASGAPMLGFLGTVTGMVKAFWQMSNAGNNIDISMLAGGIYEAMVTTVGGLIVGIVSLFAYNYLVAKIDGTVNELEQKSLAFMDLMNENENDHNKA